MGARSAGNPHAACDVEGAGNVARPGGLGLAGAPVLDPTCEGGGVRFPSATRRNIYVRTRRAGERVMASVSRFLTNKLRLKVNAGRAKAGFRSCRCGVAQKCDAKQIEAACRFRLTIFESLRCRRGPGVDR